MLLRSVFTCSVLATLVPAQLEPGKAIYSKLAFGTPGGLVIFDPVNGDYNGVTNLPFDLKGGTFGGTSCVMVNDTDGTVFATNTVGGLSGAGDVFMFQLTLDGDDVVGQVQARVGVTNGGGEVRQMEMLQDGRVLLIYDRIDSRTPPGGLLYYNPASNRFGRGPADPVLGTPDALAVDRTGMIAYVGYLTGEIWAVPLDGSQPTSITTMTDGPIDMEVDGDGQIIVATASRGMWSVDPLTGTQTQLRTFSNATAMALEPVSGELIVSQVPSGSSRMFRIDASGTSTRVGVMPTSDNPSAIDVRSSLVPYGTQHPGNPFVWRNDGNPGGAPRFGNGNFSLTVVSAGATPPGLMLIGLGRLQTPGALLPFADNLLVDLGRLLLNVGLPPGAVATVPLGLPNSTSTRGVDLWAQALHADTTTVFPFHGGQGLQIHIH